MSNAARIGMQANIANFVRQEIRVPISKPLLPIFEAISNAVDAIRDRKGPGTIRVTVLRDHDLLAGKRGSPHTFTIEDDGVGFNDENIASFDELYSDRKAHRGGKGRGRFTYLKVFHTVRISSIFATPQGHKARNFEFDTTYLGYKDELKPVIQQLLSKILSPTSFR
jgi:hypothetical protein